MNLNSRPWVALTLLCAATALSAYGCTSLKTPATADVAVSKAAVDNAASADAAEYAPIEMRLAREKLALANKALTNKDYELASQLANEARADARLAQGKANSAKAKAAADALDSDLRVLDEELQRTRK
ncbi:MAG: hypothetical protein CVU34_00235 [Betaproteobacteria bacterium HGW-Betaproteobacteria-7]|jgi:hypothetical protein|nr:MAG: hypothetical protein CVU34_00235 [Betaproteobacteria bacterium HGW-Betaproteobacteria-7]